MFTLVIFFGDWSLYMKLLRNFGYIKMFTGLWSRDRTTPLSAHHIAREDGELCKDLSCSNVWVRLSKYTGHLRPFKRALAVYIEVYMKLSLKIQCLFHWIGGGNFGIWWRNGLCGGGGGGGAGACPRENVWIEKPFSCNIRHIAHCLSLCVSPVHKETLR